MSIDDIREYKRVINRRNVKKNLSKFITKSETILYHGKKWIVVVLIPLLQILANILSLIDDEDTVDDFDKEDW